ncbi:MAG: DHHC zinc finger domain containing protein [bacterium]|nr:MAG: DHHC zinc finger domain containing protein [bacterium]
MTLFGRTLDGTEIASLVSMLLVLVLWISVWRGDRRESQWFKTWNAERKARRDAEIAGEGGTPAPPAEKGESRGPWG